MTNAEGRAPARQRPHADFFRVSTDVTALLRRVAQTPFALAKRLDLNDTAIKKWAVKQTIPLSGYKAILTIYPELKPDQALEIHRSPRAGYPTDTMVELANAFDAAHPDWKWPMEGGGVLKTSSIETKVPAHVDTRNGRVADDDQSSDPVAAAANGAAAPVGGVDVPGAGVHAGDAVDAVLGGPGRDPVAPAFTAEYLQQTSPATLGVLEQLAAALAPLVSPQIDIAKSLDFEVLVQMTGRALEQRNYEAGRAQRAETELQKVYAEALELRTQVADQQRQLSEQYRMLQEALEAKGSIVPPAPRAIIDRIAGAVPARLRALQEELNRLPKPTGLYC